MRPLRLKMTAFGPYGQEVILDFAELAENQMFVITGPTGAGKTTIFDAICYALYGDASNKERQSKGLRSDFVAEVWPDDTHFPDVLNKEARKWFGSKYKILTDKGIEGFWNDMNEPAIFYTPEGIERIKKKYEGIY